MTLFAETTSADTTYADTKTDSISLSEVTVTASPVVRRADRDLYIPSQTVKSKSSNGLSLLRNLQIPSLSVDIFMETVKADGGTVQLRINGREASVRDIKSIDPSTVVRVEFLDNPGLRYKGADCVVNIIVRNRTTGGTFMASGLASAGGPVYNGSVSAKLNVGRSQWGIDANANALCDLAFTMREHERYSLPSGEYMRTRFPQNGKSSNLWIGPSVYYNYVVPDRTNIYVSAISGFQPYNNNYAAGTLTDSEGSQLASSQYNHRHASYPQLNFYADQHIGHGQILVFNFNAGWRRERISRIYRESDSLIAYDEVQSSDRIRNFDITAEADYIKEWSRLQLTAGTRFYHSRSRTEHLLPPSPSSRSRELDFYTFAELTARLGGKLTLTGGAAADFTRYSVTGGAVRRSLSWHPRLSATHRASDASRFNLTLASWSQSPSLSQLSDVVTPIDAYRQSVGNPALKSYSAYRLRASYSLTLPRFSMQIRVQWFRAPHYIGDYNFLSDNGIVTTSYANMGYSSFEASLSPRIEVIAGWLTVSGTLQYKNIRTAGSDFRNRLSTWGGNYDLTLSHWGFSLMAQGQYGTKYLSGQSWGRSESITLLMLGYNYRSFNFIAGVFEPWGHYRNVEGVESPVFSSYTVMTTGAVRCRAFVSVSCNLQWGVQKQKARRLIDAPER